jgi:hypothetical protein
VLLAYGELRGQHLAAVRADEVSLAVCIPVPILANVVLVYYAFGINVLYIAFAAAGHGGDAAGGRTALAPRTFWSQESLPLGPAKESSQSRLVRAADTLAG